MQISVSIDEDLRQKIDRLPRTNNVSEDVRILLRALYSTPKEMSEWCQAHEVEARAAQEAVISTFERLRELSRAEIGKKP